MGDEVVVIGLDPGGLTGMDAQYVVDYANNLGLTFPIVIDTTGSYGQYSGTDYIGPFPLDVVVNRQGEITFVKRDYDLEELRLSVQAALSQ